MLEIDVKVFSLYAWVYLCICGLLNDALNSCYRAPIGSMVGEQLIRIALERSWPELQPR